MTLFNVHAKPFLKWAGGKTQLLSDIEKSLPSELFKDRFIYVEPFIGSGAVLFWILNNFPNVEKAIINDVNSDLINVYKTIKSNPLELIEKLFNLQKHYYKLHKNEEKKKEFYYQKREEFNSRNGNKPSRASLFIFLNRTCFNGLYRVNKKNFFNVPIGSYKKPRICDKDNILAVHKALQNVEILCGDFEETLSYANESSFFYFDPPYKPISDTSYFTSYSKGEFNDKDQQRLKDFCVTLSSRKSKWMLSNSDIQENQAFDTSRSKIVINKVKAKRNINSKASKRGKLNELLITNYSYEQTQPIT